MKQLRIFLLLSLGEIAIGIALIILIHYYTSFGWQVNGIIILVLFAILAFEFYVYYPHFKKPRIGKEGMIGLSGRVIEQLNPEGRVKIGGETWKAKTIENSINNGEKIEVVDIEGLRLMVRKVKG